MNLRLIVSLAIVLIMTSNSFAATDEATGFSVDPPPPCEASVDDTPGYYNATAVILVECGERQSLFLSKEVCIVAFNENQSAGTNSQEELNAALVAPESISSFKAKFVNEIEASGQAEFEIDDGTIFTIGEVTGVAFVASVRVNALYLTYYVAFIPTSRGETRLDCVVGSEYFTDALPHFQSVRESIVPP